MIPADNGIRMNPKDEIEESNGSQVKELASIDISISNENVQSQRKLSDSVKLLKFGSASAKFKRLATLKDQVSQSVPSPRANSLKERLSSMFSKKLDWHSVKNMCMEWIKNPMNMALFAWIVCVAVSGAILFLVMTGMLNRVLQNGDQPTLLDSERSERPAIGVGITISVAISAPAIAGLYIILSPLGKDYDCEMDEESQDHITSSQRQEKQYEKKYSFASKDHQQGIVENRPKWSGGILDIWNDISLAYLSLFCPFCVFGWNMERLGFGNMYVHIATFMLFCMAPFWIFILASVNIDDDNVRQALVAIGIILCFCGLLYGGFWRIQMRKRYKLPSYDFCFGKTSVSDCTLWLCCCWCSLAQEARTANNYDLLEDKSYRKEIDTCDQPSVLAPEDVVATKSSTSSPPGNRSSPSLSGPLSSSNALEGHHSPDRPLSIPKEEQNFDRCRDVIVNPPTFSLIQKEAL